MQGTDFSEFLAAAASAFRRSRATAIGCGAWLHIPLRASLPRAPPTRLRACGPSAAPTPPLCPPRWAGPLSSAAMSMCVPSLFATPFVSAPGACLFVYLLFVINYFSCYYSFLFVVLFTPPFSSAPGNVYSYRFVCRSMTVPPPSLSFALSLSPSLTLLWLSLR